MLFLYNDIAHRFELLVPRSHPFVTPWHFPCQGNLCLRRQTKRSHDVRSFCFCRHLCTVLSPATPYCSNGTRLLTGSPCPAAGGRKRGAVSRKKYRVQRPLQGQLHDNISDRSQVRALFKIYDYCTVTPSTGSSYSFLAITLLSLRDISPVRGITVWGIKKMHLLRRVLF